MLHYNVRSLDLLYGKKMSTLPDIVAIMSSKGQVVIPKIIREQLGLHCGSELHIHVKKNNILEFKVIKSDITKLFGMGAQYVSDKLIMSIEDIDNAIAQAIMEEND